MSLKPYDNSGVSAIWQNGQVGAVTGVKSFIVLSHGKTQKSGALWRSLLSTWVARAEYRYPDIGRFLITYQDTVIVIWSIDSKRFITYEKKCQCDIKHWQYRFLIRINNVWQDFIVRYVIVLIFSAVISDIVILSVSGYGDGVTIDSFCHPSIKWYETVILPHDIAAEVYWLVSICVKKVNLDLWSQTATWQYCYLDGFNDISR